MSDRELTWAVINCGWDQAAYDLLTHRTDGEATDAAARYVSELEQSIERCQTLNRMMRAQLQAVRELWTPCDCDRCTATHLAVLRALGEAS